MGEDKDNSIIKSRNLNTTALQSKQPVEHWADIITHDPSVMINDIKLRYLCRNKLPRIIFVLMHSNDYVINVLSIRPRIRR